MEADVLEEGAVAVDVVVVVGVADLRERVLEHVVVDVEIVYHEVEVEQHADTGRDEPLD